MKPVIRQYLLLAIGLLLFLFSNGNWIVPVATWLFPIFIMRFLRSQKHPLNAAICAIAYAGVSMISWQGMVPLSGLLYPIVVGGIGLLVFLPFLADKIIAPRLNGFLATLVFPLAYTTVEYLASLVNPYGTWTFLGYTQFGNLPLMQIVSVTGIFGLTFLITWFAAVVNWIWEQEFSWPRISKGVTLYVGVMLAVLLFGGASLVYLAPGSQTVLVAGVDTPLYETQVVPAPANKAEPSEENLKSIIALYKVITEDLFTKSTQAAQGGAKVIFWPELSTGVLKQDEPPLIERGKQLAQKEGIYLGMAFGALLHTKASFLPDDKPRENKIVTIGPAGQVLSTYLKTIAVPGGEAAQTVKGDGVIPIISTPLGRIASTICYDMDFPSLIRTAGNTGADIVFAPSGDWRDIDPYHTNMTAFRAIENGFSVVRVVRRGLSAAYDYQGRTLATMDYFKTEDKVMMAHVPEKGVRTIYSQVGDLFSWLCIASLAAIVGWVILRRKHTASSKRES